jgi:glutamyl-Q tRNA(Asp) synthetase
MHIPVAVNAEGQKLSKLTGAPGIDTSVAATVLHKAFEVLRQSPPATLATASPATQWQWALETWNATPLSGVSSIDTPEYGA